MSGDGKRHVVSVELEVPFHDVDSLNIVWHGHYYKYVEIARTALMRSVQLDNDQLRALGCGLVMGETQCKHTGVLRYGDRFRVDAWFKDVSQRLCIAYEVRKTRMLGSAALAMAYIACGRLDAYVEEQISLWDIAAGQLMVEEGGGKVMLKPSTTKPGTMFICASNGKLPIDEYL